MKWSDNYIEKRFNIKNEEFYPLFISDMDYELPREIIDPMIDLVKAGDFGYFDIKDSFMNSIKEWYKNKYNCYIENNWIVPSIGALTSMNVFIRHFFNKGDNILIFTPVYGPFGEIILNNDMNLVKENLELINNRYFINFGNLKNKIIAHSISGIIFCNPHNPSGRCWDNKEIEELINICKDKNIILISDEVHGDLTINKNKFESFAKYFDMYEKIVVVSSPNKTFNVAGINISTYVVKNKEIREKLAVIHKVERLHPNRLGCEFLTICYENGYPWVEALNNYIEKNLNNVINMLKYEGINIMIPDAGYLIWVNLDKITNMNDFVLRLAKETGVLLEAGSRFVNDNEGWFRVNVATSGNILEVAIPKIVEFYKKYIKLGKN